MVMSLITILLCIQALSVFLWKLKHPRKVLNLYNSVFLESNFNIKIHLNKDVFNFFYNKN